MKNIGELLALALLVLGGCATVAPEPTTDGRCDDVVSVLHAHGFAPPTIVRAADSSIWIVGSRPGKPKSRSVDHVIVRLPDHTATPTVEIRGYVQGPSDWAILGNLLGGDELAAEARSIQDDLRRRLTQD